MMFCCEQCQYWEKDYGIWCMNGWSGERNNNGYCHYEIEKVHKMATDFCHHYTPTNLNKEVTIT